MDLEVSKSDQQGAFSWPRFGMLLCFTIAAGILLFTMCAPNAAHSKVFTQSQLP